MKIAQIKKEMLEHRDFFGGDILNLDEIDGEGKKKLLKLTNEEFLLKRKEINLTQ